MSTYDSVVYQGLYPGIEVVFREAGQLEYDILVQPGADLSQVVIRCEGAESLQIDESGALVIETSCGPLRQKSPKTWLRLASGEERPVDCRYVILGENRYGFAIDAEPGEHELVIDPELDWSTFLGGRDSDQIRSVAVGPSGDVFVAGFGALDFPTTPGAFKEGPVDTWYGFIARLDSSGTRLVYSTYLGERTEISAIAVDAAGQVTATGYTDLPQSFPTTPGAFDRSPNGGTDTFVTRLDPTGSSLVYSTLVGGQTIDLSYGIDIDSQGGAVIVGRTNSVDFPTTPGAFDRTHNDRVNLTGDAYVTFLDPTGSSLVYSTYLGGENGDGCFAVSIDGAGRAIVCGGTASPNFPTTPGAFGQTFRAYAGFVAAVTPSSGQLSYSTLLSGSSADSAEAITCDSSGVATVTGYTQSTDFPTTPGAFSTQHSGGFTFKRDAFVCRIDPTGTQLLYSTFLGGSHDERGRAVLVQPDGAMVVYGETRSADFPVVEGSYSSVPGPGDNFISRLDPSGARLLYSTFIGGDFEEYATGADLGPDGSVVVVGYTWNPGYPTTPGAFDRTFNNGFFTDGFITKLVPGPVVAVDGVPAAGSPVRFHLFSAPAPQIGKQAQILVSCSGTDGLPLPGGWTLPLTFDPCLAWTARNGTLFRGTIDNQGETLTPWIPFPSVPIGVQLHAAGVTYDSAAGRILSLTCPIEFVTQ
ncbi:MAG: hypothetical protein RL885_08720 [Planctomycetota bacterium]